MFAADGAKIDRKVSLRKLPAQLAHVFVLFDIADFRALGGVAFRDTWFFRSSANEA